MGSTRHYSWSFSRQAAYENCPRCYFFKYFPWGEPEQDILSFLRLIQTVPLLAGTIVHDILAIAIRQFSLGCVVAPNLGELGVNRYEMLVKESLRVSKIVRSGKRPYGKNTVLAHHLECGPSETIETAGRESVRDSLSAFESSEAWKFIRATKPFKWMPVPTDFDEFSHIYASRILGFERAIGVRIYTVYDFAFKHNQDTYIVDWKTGKKSPSEEERARKQTVLYSLWALEQGVPLNHVYVQLSAPVENYIT